MRVCEISGCYAKHESKGYCKRHYDQLRHSGKAKKYLQTDRNEIIMKKDFAEVELYDKQGNETGYVLIDKEDIDYIKNIKWSLGGGSDGCYVRGKKKGKGIYLHRFLLKCPEDKVVDHINHNRLDNRKKNLRICTSSQNNMNRRGVFGVFWDKKNNKWRVNIKINKKNIWLGRHKNFEDALKARVKAEIKYFKEFRCKNKSVLIL